MDKDGDRNATAGAERLLMEFGLTEEEAQFIREQAKAIYETVLNRFISQRGNMRPMALEMTIAYPSFWAGDWARKMEQAEGTNA